MAPGHNTSSATDTAGGSGVSGGDEREGAPRGVQKGPRCHIKECGLFYEGTGESLKSLKQGSDIWILTRSSRVWYREQIGEQARQNRTFRRRVQ